MNAERLVTGYYERFNDTQIDELVKLFCDDAVMVFVGSGQHSGRENIESFIVNQLFRQFRRFSFRPVHTVVKDNLGAVEGKFEGETTAGKSFAIGFAQIFELSELCISRTTVYIDAPALREQVGRW